MEAFESLDMPFNMTIGQAQSEIKLQFNPEQWKAFARLVEHHEYTRTDGENLIHRKLTSQSSDGTVQTNVNLLQQAIIQSKKETIGHTANSYLAITVGDFLNPANKADGQLLKEWLEKTQNFIFPDIWPIHCTDILNSDSRKRITRPGFGVPYTVYPLPSDYAAAIVTGYIQVYYRLNTTAVVQAFREAGFEAECLLGAWRTQGNSPPNKETTAYFKVHRRAITLTIHALPVEQILFDGLLLEDLIASVVTHFDAEEARKDIIVPAHIQQNMRRFHAMFTCTNMEEAWRTSRSYISPFEFEVEEDGRQ
ncbi:MAG: hypothetical protein ACJ797_08985 [Ktedonobacteraceae bacterium]